MVIAISVVHGATAGRPKEVRNITWGTPISMIPELRFDHEVNGWLYYVRPTDTLVVAEAPVARIAYAVREGKIVGVTVNLQRKDGERGNGYGACLRVTKMFENIYGKPDEVETKNPFGGPVIVTTKRRFAHTDDEASVELTCPLSVDVPFAFFSFRWKGYEKARSGL